MEEELLLPSSTAAIHEAKLSGTAGDHIQPKVASTTPVLVFSTVVALLGSLCNGCAVSTPAMHSFINQFSFYSSLIKNNITDLGGS